MRESRGRVEGVFLYEKILFKITLSIDPPVLTERLSLLLALVVYGFLIAFTVHT